MMITRQLVELHGGTIRGESKGQGHGATFTIELPILVVHDTKTSGSQAPNSWSASGDPSRLPKLDGLHILLVDDEHDAREMLTAVLGGSGAKVSAVGTVAEAIETLMLVKPDLLVSDINLNGETGYSLIAAVRALEGDNMRSIPAIALTAEASFPDRMRALLAGFHLHVPKPVEPAELITLIANLTDRK